MPQQREFALPGLTLAAQVWGRRGGIPVLALHGWLDNASTFDLLAPLVPECELVALDLAGHGRSGFRSPDAAYNVWEDVGDVLEVAEQLGWRRFNLLGHSRGAAIAMLFAASFPEQTDRVVLIEGGVPILGTAADAPATLARSFRERRELRSKTGRVFLDRETAIAERARGFTKLTPAAAEILARRSLREVDGGFQWHADQRLKGTPEMRLTHEQVRAFVARVEAPVLMVLAQESPFGGTELYREMIAAFEEIETVLLPGAHHLHLEGAEAEIAALVRRFLGAA
ncbi:MAG TPA: alpha/beta hydrolase [Gammaproteobacteria bacterium]|nr:alpha/beta hydrolase [Gammaproteobacteria bacterium]